VADFDNAMIMPMKFRDTKNGSVVIHMEQINLGANIRGVALACLYRQYGKLKSST
jgi:hypothetical protein